MKTIFQHNNSRFAYRFFKTCNNGAQRFYSSASSSKPLSKFYVALPIAGGSLAMYFISLHLFYNSRPDLSEKVIETGLDSTFVGLVKEENRASSRLHLLEEQIDQSSVYDDIANQYDDKIKIDEFVIGMYLLRRWLIKRNAMGDVLELSAGTGRNLKYYFPTIDSRFEINSLTFVEKSENMNQISKNSELTAKLVKQFMKEKKRIRFYTQDAHHLKDFGDNSFDTVIDTFGLCSYSDPIQVVKEMQRVCKPEGKILFLQHGVGFYDFLNNLLDKNASKHAEKWGCWWNRDINEILSEAGLGECYSSRWHFGTTHYIIAKPKKS